MLVAAIYQGSEMGALRTLRNDGKIAVRLEAVNNILWSVKIVRFLLAGVTGGVRCTSRNYTAREGARRK